ncbi:hypothetical protein GQ44DRAFT_765218 [Phaeosphaeriaceae sp. PMI808]|nr:hypothetical protein GQ44DRAFT_765218 [Phaeosphaeriaceae sp. PMI808]
MSSRTCEAKGAPSIPSTTIKECKRYRRCFSPCLDLWKVFFPKTGDDDFLFQCEGVPEFTLHAIAGEAGNTSAVAQPVQGSLTSSLLSSSSSGYTGFDVRNSEQEEQKLWTGVYQESAPGWWNIDTAQSQARGVRPKVPKGGISSRVACPPWTCDKCSKVFCNDSLLHWHEETCKAVQIPSAGKLALAGENPSILSLLNSPYKPDSSATSIDAVWEIPGEQPTRSSPVFHFQHSQEKHDMEASWAEKTGQTSTSSDTAGVKPPAPPRRCSCSSLCYGTISLDI